MADEAIERLDLQHPLPEELRELPRDETVCKFCGVSYLIHNEIKALEDKLKAIEKELNHYKGCEAREEQLKEQLQERDKEIIKLRTSLGASETTIETLRNNLNAVEGKLEKESIHRQNVEKQLKATELTVDLFRGKHGLLVQTLPGLRASVVQHRNALQELRTAVTNQKQDMSHDSNQLAATVAQLCSQQVKDVDHLQVTIKSLQDEKTVLNVTMGDLERKLALLEVEKKSLQGVSDVKNELQLQCSQLRNKIFNLERDLEDAVSNSRKSILDSEQYREQLRVKGQEIEQMTAQMRARDLSAEQSFARLQRDLVTKEASLETVQNDLKALKRKYEEQTKAEEEIKRKASSSFVKTEELESEMKRVKADCDALRSEREMLIIAHQNQIEQLRESFKKRVAEADSWSQKMDEALKNERQKQAVEIQSLEQKLKENFIMELQIEKQKHQELLNKYQMENRDDAKQLKLDLNSMREQHKSELSDVHRQMAESKARSRETENTLRREVESLKGIIKDLENRLAKLDSGNDQLVVEMKDKLKDLEADLEEIQGENRKLNHQVAAGKEEVLFLQETVRRECEERLELTDALSEAKEELLALKKPPGGFSKPPGSGKKPRPDSPQSIKSSSSRSSVASRSEEMMLYKRTAGKSVPHPPFGALNSQDKDSAESSSVEVGFEGGVKPAGKNLHGPNAMKDSRRRIAQAVGRR